MVENLDAIRSCQERQITVEHEALELLLFNFLQEPVYYKDAEQLLLVVTQVEIARHAGRYRLTATARGERLDPARHHLRVDVEAVTLHRFRLQQRAGGWEALVILDISDGVRAPPPCARRGAPYSKGGPMLHLDGSRFSGSGTIVRFGVPLAALTGQALHLTNVRARRAPQDSGPNICRRWKP